MITKLMEQYDVSELSGLEAREVEGGRIAEDIGYAVGACVAYATNAAGIMNGLMLDALKGRAFDKIFK